MTIDDATLAHHLHSKTIATPVYRQVLTLAPALNLMYATPTAFQTDHLMQISGTLQKPGYERMILPIH
jgi:hypothetical protein